MVKNMKVSSIGTAILTSTLACSLSHDMVQLGLSSFLAMLFFVFFTSFGLIPLVLTAYVSKQQKKEIEE